VQQHNNCISSHLKITIYCLYIVQQLFDHYVSTGKYDVEITDIGLCKTRTLCFEFDFSHFLYTNLNRMKLWNKFDTFNYTHFIISKLLKMTWEQI